MTRETPGDGTAQAREMRREVVWLILDKNPEGALDLLSKWYRVPRPKLGVGAVKGKGKRVAAVYSVRRREILAANSDYLYDPFTLVHEFYHHLRSQGGKHRGTEKEADRFAARFVAEYLADARFQTRG